METQIMNLVNFFFFSPHLFTQQRAEMLALRSVCLLKGPTMLWILDAILSLLARTTEMCLILFAQFQRFIFFFILFFQKAATFGGHWIFSQRKPKRKYRKWLLTRLGFNQERRAFTVTTWSNIQPSTRCDLVISATDTQTPNEIRSGPVHSLATLLGGPC